MKRLRHFLVLLLCAIAAPRESQAAATQPNILFLFADDGGRGASIGSQIDHSAVAFGIKLGHHIVAPRDTPLCNAWVTLLQGSGIKVERHGDSSGVLKELLA